MKGAEKTAGSWDGQQLERERAGRERQAMAAGGFALPLGLGFIGNRKEHSFSRLSSMACRVH